MSRGPRVSLARACGGLAPRGRRARPGLGSLWRVRAWSSWSPAQAAPGCFRPTRAVERAPARSAPAPLPGAGTPPQPSPDTLADPSLVRLRFGWPAAGEVQRRSAGPGCAPARRPRRRRRASPSGSERRDGALRISTAGTTWEGDAPARAAGRGGRRAARVRGGRAGGLARGRVPRLEGVEALRRLAMARLLEAAVRRIRWSGRSGSRRPRCRRRRARWNLAVGFWIGADLELGERYGMRTEAEVPLVGTKAEFEQEFSVRRRVPCSARHPRRGAASRKRCAPPPTRPRCLASPAR